jgi:hypothetical protein
LIIPEFLIPVAAKVVVSLLKTHYAAFVVKIQIAEEV